MDLDTSTTDVILNKKGNDNVAHVNSDKTDHQKLHTTHDMLRFKDNMNAREFLERLKHTVSSYVGEDEFEKRCDRYLKYLTIETPHHNKLEKNWQT